MALDFPASHASTQLQQPRDFNATSIIMLPLSAIWLLSRSRTGPAASTTALTHSTPAFIIVTCLHPTVPPIPSRTLSNFEKHGYSHLSDFGQWMFNHDTSLPFAFAPKILLFPCNHYLLTRDWPLIRSFLSLVPDNHFRTLSHPQLFIPQGIRQLHAESHLIYLFNAAIPRISDTPLHLFASDASYSFTLRSLHTSVVALNKSFPVSLADLLPSATTQHAEAYGIIICCLLALSAQHAFENAPIIYTDHLPSVKLLTPPSPLPHQILSNPARSLYRWLFDILRRFSPPSAPTVLHVKAHTDTDSIPCNLNRLADFVASHSHSYLPPNVPSPSFFFDTFVTFDNSSHNGFFESSLFDIINLRLVNTTFNSLICSLTHPFSDATSPPEHPYTVSRSAFSAVVQLYARSRQLPSNLTMSRRFPSRPPWCRFGCPHFESTHHLFLHCPRFSAMRTTALDDCLSASNSILQAFNTDLRSHPLLSSTVRELLQPIDFSEFYLGILPDIEPILHRSGLSDLSPTLFSRLHTRLARSWHTAAIHLAARIWGAVMRARTHHPSAPPKPSKPKIALPQNLAPIIPHLSDSSFVSLM
ncbi:hypothetical protein H0H92_007993 [Tricholoma furcatifolium]|nr:hypothetical protein H0H92_007993 [Tricholoma furcatifolium]